ncbi:hypothetical protein PC121_g21210 [Phytophthora cactorum]|nr:hypothetical protein PC121_g21210 [Phytophthora cactorum]
MSLRRKVVKVTEKMAFTWRGDELPREGGLWRLIPVDGAFAIYVSQDTYLISPPATGSAFRRLVVTSSYRPLDQSWSEGHKWQIKPAAPSLLERGLDDYFTKDYTAAVDSFTALLEAEKLSPVASIKVYWYRMVASLKLQKKEFFREDGDLLGMIDGCPKYFLEATKDVLGEDLTTIEATELAQYKEKLLEATLTAKQSTENCLVCTVLNAKKDEVDKSSLGAIFLVEVVKIEQ